MISRTAAVLLTVAILACQTLLEVNAEQQQHSLLRRKVQEEPSQQVADVADLGNTTANIIGGTPSQATYPYFGYWDRGCGASLVAPDIMLTAAHCTRGNFGGNGKVYFGSLYLEQGASLGVVSMVPHPRHDPSTENSDFAIIKLSGSALRIGAAPISLNRNNANPPAGYTRLLVIGFGLTEGGFQATRLQQAQVIAEDRTCRNAYSDDRFDPNVMLCASHPAGRDACQGTLGWYTSRCRF